MLTHWNVGKEMENFVKPYSVGLVKCDSPRGIGASLQLQKESFKKAQKQEKNDIRKLLRFIPWKSFGFFPNNWFLKISRYVSSKRLFCLSIENKIPPDDNPICANNTSLYGNHKGKTSICFRCLVFRTAFSQIILAISLTDTSYSVPHSQKIRKQSIHLSKLGQIESWSRVGQLFFEPQNIWPHFTKVFALFSAHWITENSAW